MVYEKSRSRDAAQFSNSKSPASSVKFSCMENPFKKDDAVLTKVKQREVQATITKVWKNEVQVKTADGDLLWRTMYTVWRASEEPLTREAKPTPQLVAEQKPKEKRVKPASSVSKSQRRKRR